MRLFDSPGNHGRKCFPLHLRLPHQGSPPLTTTDRAIRRLLLSNAIVTVHAESRGVYGYRRVQATLRMQSDVVVNHKLVASIMAQLGIHGPPHDDRGDGIW